MKKLSYVTVFSIFFIFASAAPFLFRVGLPSKWRGYGVERFWSHLGSYSMDLSFILLGLFIVLLLLPLTKSSRALNGVLIYTIQGLRKSHLVVGWVVVVLALLHSWFFLYKLSPKASDNISGIAALLLLLAATILGIPLIHHKKRKSRYWHLLLGIVGIALFLLHKYYAVVHQAEHVYTTYYGG